MSAKPMPPRDPAGGSGGAIGRLKPCFAESSGVYKSQRNHDGFQAEISRHGHCVFKGQREFVNAGRRGLAGRNPLHTLCVWPGVARIARSTRAERQSCSIVKPADDIAAHSVRQRNQNGRTPADVYKNMVWERNLISFLQFQPLEWCL